MQALTKKHRAEAVEIKLIDPVANLNRALNPQGQDHEIFGGCGCVRLCPVARCLPRTHQNEHGTVLRGARLKEDLTQTQLAEKIVLRPHHISEMEHGKRVIGKVMAKKLASVLNTSYKMLL